MNGLALGVLIPVLISATPQQVRVEIMVEQYLFKIVETGKCYIYYNDHMSANAVTTTEVNCP